MQCPRQAETGQTPTRPVQIQLRHGWKCCSYCGSLIEPAFFEALDQSAQLGPTDKSYKVYVDVKNFDAGRPKIVSSANYKHDAPGWVKVTAENRDSLPLDKWQRDNWVLDDEYWVQLGTESERVTLKFYFQHLSREGMMKFIDLYNANKLNIGYPGHFYTMPFFMRPIK